MADFVVAHIGTCWWCGATADSREHKFKKTDLERGFGIGPYYDGRTLVRRGYEGHSAEMTGARSGGLKFRPMICQKCNNERSQRFDRAYDQFMAHLSEHIDEVGAAESVDLREVFGESWCPASGDLVRYFIKHICCRLANVSDRRVIWLDKRLHECLNGGGFPECLQLDLLLDVGVLEFLRLISLLPDEHGRPAPEGTFLHLTGIWGAEDDPTKPLEQPQAGMTVGGFGFHWRISDDGIVPNPFGGPVVSLPATDWTFSSEVRAAFARISDAIESGAVDPTDETLADLVAQFAPETLGSQLLDPDAVYPRFSDAARRPAA